MGKYDSDFNLSYSNILKWLFIGFSVVALIVIFLFAIAIGFRYYGVWSAEMKGKARLMEASQSKQIMIESAKAEVEASKLRAEAIEVIGKKAKEYPEYRMQEFIGAFGEALNNGNINTIIYVPTEANIPVMEAGRLTKKEPKVKQEESITAKLLKK